MKNTLLTITAFTFLIAGQLAMANDSSGEVLNWLATSENTTQVEQAPQFSKVSMMTVNDLAKADAFSLDYSSDK